MASAQPNSCSVPPALRRNTSAKPSCANAASDAASAAPDEGNGRLPKGGWQPRWRLGSLRICIVPADGASASENYTAAASENYAAADCTREHHAQYQQPEARRQ